MSEFCNDTRSERDTTVSARMASSPASRKAQSGPRLLFFSGGTALRPLSRELVQYTHNSVHIITPFDSGGSSAILRQAFHMPAVGDLRNRLLALADRSRSGHRAMCRLAASRFPATDDPGRLLRSLDDLSSGRDSLVAVVGPRRREIACRNLDVFRNEMPAGFDLRGASIGNLLITGSWLHHGRRLDPALREFTWLIRAQGTVRPVVDGDYHLAVELEDGETLLGQRQITGKEVEAIASPVRRIWLTAGENSLEPVLPGVDATTTQLIANADLICYPPGSFYTSIVANLLPRGVAEAIVRARCPKVYMPGLGEDPEALGLDVFKSATRLVRTMEQGLQHAEHPSRLLTHVMVDTARGRYQGREEIDSLERLGIECMDVSLISDDSAPLIDGKKAIGKLLSLI